MKPLDPRLVRTCLPVRRHVLTCVAAAGGQALTMVVLALTLAWVITEVVGATASPTQQVTTAVFTLLCVFAARTLIAGVFAHASERSSTRAIADLREQAFDAVTASDHRYGTMRAQQTSAALGDGLEALGPYLSRFVPQLVATMLVSPLLVAVTWYFDPIAAVIEILGLPLIPLFMALVGWATASAARKRLVAMQRLLDQVTDLLAGLATLRHVRRAAAQEATVTRAATGYRAATMSVLRQAFLSSLVLEVLTTLLVAIVAVAVGLRLLNGHMEFYPALVVLILAPEVFAPLRMVGQHYHASADGVAAAHDVLELVALPARGNGTRAANWAATHQIVFTGVAVATPDGAHRAPSGVSGVARAGSITCIDGPNGSGKSTTLAVVLGLLEPTGGAVSLNTSNGCLDIAELDRTSWHKRCAFAPQEPIIDPGTIDENVWWPENLDTDARERIMRASQLDDVCARAPQGTRTVIGRGGFGLSAGQRHRIGLARALAAVAGGADVLLVDEPGAHLDDETAARVADALRKCSDAGALVIVCAHRGPIRAEADTVIAVQRSTIADPEPNERVPT